VLVIGRFQPPHEGHVRLIAQALSLGEKLAIVIGSAQESYTLRNPLTAGERFSLLEKLIESRFRGDMHRISIVPVMDINMNKVWVRYLEMLLPPFSAVVTRNPLVAELFSDAGYRVFEQELYRRRECSGTRIRELASRGDPSWRACVPPEILGDLEALDFQGRLERLSRGD